MTREQIDKLLPVLHAYAEGRDIQYRERGLNGPNWVTAMPDKIANLGFYEDCEYRIKPEPRAIWVNRYDNARWGIVYESKDDAIRARGHELTAITCKFVQVDS